MLKFGNDKFYFEVIADERQNLQVPIRIRINNEVLGTFHSSTYIPSFLGGLHRLMSDKYYFTNELNQSSLQLKLKESLELSDRYIFTLEETFDDYIKRALRNDNDVYFMWYISQDHFFEYKSEELNRLIYTSVTRNDFLFAYNSLIDWTQSFLHPNFNFKIENR